MKKKIFMKSFIRSDKKNNIKERKNFNRFQVF